MLRNKKIKLQGTTLILLIVSGILILGTLSYSLFIRKNIDNTCSLRLKYRDYKAEDGYLDLSDNNTNGIVQILKRGFKQNDKCDNITITFSDLSLELIVNNQPYYPPEIRDLVLSQINYHNNSVIINDNLGYLLLIAKNDSILISGYTENGVIIKNNKFYTMGEGFSYLGYNEDDEFEYQRDNIDYYYRLLSKEGCNSLTDDDKKAFFNEIGVITFNDDDTYSLNKEITNTVADHCQSFR